MLRDWVSRFFGILELVRFWEWQDKVYLMMVSVLLLLIYSPKRLSGTTDILFVLIYAYIAFSYAYLSNSYFDREKDEKVGRKHLEGFSDKFVRGALVLLGSLTLFYPLLFANWGIAVFGIFIFIVGTFYSAPPLRFKEKGEWGLFVAGFFQRSPLLFFLFLEGYKSTVTLFLFGWLIIIGFMVELGHQISDFQDDRDTGSKTFTVKFGPGHSRKLISVVMVAALIYAVLPAVWSFPKYLLMTATLIVFSQPSFSYAYDKMCAARP